MFKRFAFWFAFSFILNGYASGIPGISLGSFVFLFMIIVSFIINLGQIKRNNLIYLLIFSFLIISVLGYSTVGLYGNPLIGILKLIIWALMINQVCPTCFRFDAVIRWMNIFSTIIIAYLILQLIAYHGLETYLPNIFNIGPLQPYDPNYADYERLSQSFVYRPASFLSESAFCGNYLLVTLLLNLEKSKNILDNIKFLIFLSLGIVLCSSTSALVLLLVAWGIYFNKISFRWRMALIACVVVGVLGVVNKPIEFESDSSIGYSLEKFNNLESSSRFGNSYNYLSLLQGRDAKFGVGVGNETAFLMSRTPNDHIYLNSVTNLLFSVGYTGTFIMCLFILYLFVLSIVKRSHLSFCLLLFYFVKAFGSGILFSTYGILFLMIVYADIVYGSYCKAKIN